jgi:membrane protein DedA with SNARE-associated domain
MSLELLSILLADAVPYLHLISFFLLILSGLNFPISEDLVFIMSASIAAVYAPERAVLIFIGCFSGALLSDIMVYGAGKYIGPNVLKISFFKRFFPEKVICSIKRHYLEHGNKTLFFGRFIPFGVRNILFLTAGLVNINFKKFIIVDICALSVTLLIWYNLGYAAGGNYAEIIPFLNNFRFFVIASAFTLWAFIIIKRVSSKRVLHKDN